jgi:hypothetical protein
MAAALVIGLFLGWLLTAVVSLAAISRAQERMQRKADYWQGEYALAHQEADRLTRLLEERGGGPNAAPEQDWQ